MFILVKICRFTTFKFLVFPEFFQTSNHYEISHDEQQSHYSPQENIFFYINSNFTEIFTEGLRDSKLDFDQLLASF